MALAASGLYNLSLNLLSVHQIRSPCQLAHLRVAVTYRPQENKSPMIVSVRQTAKDHTPLGNKKTGLLNVLLVPLLYLQYLCLYVQTLLIQKTIASSRSKGSSLEALKVEKRLTEATTFSMLIISTV